MASPRPIRTLDTFRYMAFAKALEQAPGTFLAGSASPRSSDEILGWSQEDFDIDALCAVYGDVNALDALSSRFEVDPSCISLTLGSSEANNLLYQLLLEPGDEVLAESPGYEVFHKLAALHGAKFVPLPRRPENGFLPDPDEFRSLLNAKTRLVVLTDLHNPTMVKLPADQLRSLIDIAAENGTYVLVDEIYLDYLEVGEADRTCFHYGDNVIVTSSLTKVYGLGNLRFGWCFAPEPVTTALMDLIDLTTAQTPTITQKLGAKAIQRLDQLRTLPRQLHERGLPIIQQWVESDPSLSFQAPAGGVSATVRVEGLGSSYDFVEYLIKNQGVVVAPGEAFQLPDWLRINYGAEPSVLRPALERVSAGIKSYRS